MAVESSWGVLKPLVGAAALAMSTQATNSAKKDKRWGWGDESDDDDDGFVTYVVDGASGGAEPEVPLWEEALAKGTPYDVPVRPEEVESSAKGLSVSSEGGEAVVWGFPATQEQRHRYLVFKDLRAKGFYITGGSKFGADFLLYPGDPTLYHAQFCVRLMAAEVPIVPALLASACRGSFQARKHLLIASVVQQNDSTSDEAGEKIIYTTLGPVDGFG